MKQKFVSHFLYWILPSLCVASVFIALAIGPEAVNAWVVSPQGFLENSPSFFLIIGICYCVALLRNPHVWENKSLRYWLITFIIASIYFGGEDENWGEYWFNWDVPDYFLQHNKEHETNLHNMSTWFNQKPRLIMEIWALVACMLVPLGWEWPKKITHAFVPDVLWPKTKSFVYVVILAIVIDVVDKLDKHVFTEYSLMATGVRMSEVQEMVLAYLMFLYARYLYGKLRSKTISL